MRIGIVCEGPTDYVVLSAVCRAALGGRDHSFTLLQPAFDLLKRGDPQAKGPGWQGVRAFLQQTGTSLGASVQDLLVVHLDADIRHLPEVHKHLGLEGTDDDLSPLCDHIKSWVPGPVPEKLVIVIPREATEAWLVAAHTKRHDVEAISRPVDVLQDAGLVGGAPGKPEKRSPVYEQLAGGLAALLGNKRRMAEVPELGRFLGKLHARAKATQKRTRATS
jgi:hypothetical protein